MPISTLAIVNAFSASGGTGRRWSKIETLLREALGPLEVEHTQAPRDARRIAREAARSGVERLVVAGGDGTANEVVDGLLTAGLAERVQVGVLPLGTGGDFARELRVPRDMRAAVEALRSGATRRLDAGRIEYQGADGRPCTSHFINVASFGLSGLVDRYVRRVPRRLGGTLSYFIGSLMGIARYDTPSVALRVDGELVHEGPLVLAAAANGGYFGGGMHIAPDAQWNDGLLDVVVVGGLSKLGVVANLPSIYLGRHLRLSEVSIHRGSRIEAEAPGYEVWLDVDGDPLGTLPARIEVLPSAITLFGAVGRGAAAKAG